MKKINDRNRYYCHARTIARVDAKKKTAFIGQKDPYKDDKYLHRLRDVYNYAVQFELVEKSKL